jgi:prepilin-type N-terminal cleavage/methylation domain-containing protein
VTDSVPVRRRGVPRRRGFTLLELLAVVTILGIAAALLIPSMSQTGILRVQAAVRTIISDITFAQADAVAFQERRAIVFDVDTSSYRLVQVPGDTIDVELNTMYDPGRENGRYIVNFNDAIFGGARITAVNFDGGNTLIFDALGGPVADAAGDEPGSGGTITVVGSGSTFTIGIEAFTGRVTATRVEAPPGNDGGDTQPGN